MKLTPKFKDSFDSVPSLFFSVFDTNNRGILGRSELGVGLFLLCGGTLTEKLRYIGQVFDENKDGRLTKTDLLRFFSLFYRFTLDKVASKVNKGALEKELSMEMTKKLFEKTKVPANPGVPIQVFSKMERSLLVNPGSEMAGGAAGNKIRG